MKIRTREAQSYAGNGYYVIQNTTEAHVQITEEGLHIKNGETMALSEINDFCQNLIDRGFIRLLAKPTSIDASKKNKKRAEGPSGFTPESTLLENLPATSDPVVLAAEGVSSNSFDNPANAAEEI